MGRNSEGVGVMEDKDLNLDQKETSHTLGGVIGLYLEYVCGNHFDTTSLFRCQLRSLNKRQVLYVVTIKTLLRNYTMRVLFHVTHSLNIYM